MTLLLSSEADRLTIKALQARVSQLEAELEKFKNPRSPFVSVWRAKNGLHTDDGAPKAPIIFPPKPDPDKPPKNKRRVVELPVAEGVHPVLRLPEARQVGISAVALLPRRCQSTLQQERRERDRKETIRVSLGDPKFPRTHRRNEEEGNRILRNLRTRVRLQGAEFGFETLKASVVILLGTGKLLVDPIPSPSKVSEEIPYISAYCMGLLMAANTFEPWGINSDWLTLFDKQRFAEMRPLGLLRVTTYPNNAMEIALSDLGKVAVEEFDLVSDERGREAVEVMTDALELVADCYAKVVASNPPIGISPEDLEALLLRNRNRLEREAEVAA